MDYYNHENKSWQEEQYRQYNPSFQNPGLTMATVSLFLGLAALFSTLTVFVPILFGGLAIVFALLSKGYGKKMLTQAKVGLTCGIAGFGITIAILAYSFITVFMNPDILIQIGQQYDATYESMYGHSSEEAFGSSFEDIMKGYVNALQH